MLVFPNCFFMATLMVRSVQAWMYSNHNLQWPKTKSFVRHPCCSKHDSDGFVECTTC